MNTLDFNTRKPLSPHELGKLLERANNGDYLSYHYLGLHYLTKKSCDMTLALKYLNIAADNGISSASTVLGDIYYDGLFEILPNIDLALTHYNNAANLDDIEAIRALAIHHYKRFLQNGSHLELSLSHSFADKAKRLGDIDIYNYIMRIISSPYS